ncbi:MAG: PAS-family protein [Caulobacteraceae bacterium]|nr:PAS-family protein [Caulobacteraceae bacterium]
MSNLRSIAIHVTPIATTTLGEAVYDRFRAEPDLLIAPIIDDEGRPVGLVERHDFILRMAAEYGRAIYARRPITAMKSPPPLTIDADADLADFTRQMLSERASDLMRGFIVTEQERYLGVGSALALLQKASASQQRTMRALQRTAERLKRATGEAVEAQAFMTAVVENIPALVSVRRVEDGGAVLFNRAAETLLGLSRTAVIEGGANPMAAALSAQERQALADGQTLTTEDYATRRADGSPLLLRLKTLGIPAAAGHPAYLLSVGEDITERREAEARIAHLAHYDSLTGLPNRALFHKELAKALRGRRHGQVAVLCLDLDHFKAVNDTLGHPIGDELLSAAAGRLCACLREDDVAARLGGDEFAVILSCETGEAIPAALAARIVKSMAEPFEVSGHEVRIGVSIGIAVSPLDAADADGLLKKADLALYRVKSEGRSGYHFFEKAMDDRMQDRRRMELDLRRALTAGEFELHYQPLVRLSDGKIVGCEALLRWRHPSLGLVSPADFIPLAEEIGLIVPIGEWVLREACHQAAQWPSHIRIAVNISPVQFRKRNLLQIVIAALSASGLAANRLELEITESVLLQDNEANLAMLHGLRALGVRISMDDFGTGYSSLSYLRSFPFDKIKIDQSFVRDLPGDAEAMAIIKAVTSLGASLGITTTAEGVETPQQLEELRRQGCCEIQGYLISRPAPAAEIDRLLAAEARTRHAA